MSVRLPCGGHLSGLLGGFIIPLVIWAIYKDKPGYELARRAAARAFNFGLTGYLIVLITLLSGFVYILRWSYPVWHRPTTRAPLFPVPWGCSHP